LHQLEPKPGFRRHITIAFSSEVDAGPRQENASKQDSNARFLKFMFSQSDKLGVIDASISLIDAAANCRHGAQAIFV
jgi:hypothetical protein